MVLFDEKTEGQKSRDTVPLRFLNSSTKQEAPEGRVDNFSCFVAASMGMLVTKRVFLIGQKDSASHLSVPFLRTLKRLKLWTLCKMVSVRVRSSVDRYGC
jgi:hypothetical protein